MPSQRSGRLISGLFALLLVPAPAEAQSFGPATWIRQAWIEGDDFIPMDITIGLHEEVFVTGLLSVEEDAWFEASADSADIRMLDTPPAGAGFLVRYDGETGKLGFVQPGSVLPVEPPSIASDYSTGYSVAVVDGRLFHGEGLGPNEAYRAGSAMVTVRDLEGSAEYRIGPRERIPIWWSIYIQGIRFDAQGNLYLAGTYRDTLYFSPDVVLAPSRRPHHHTWDVFVASYAPDGLVRWAHQVEGGTGDLWISNGWFGRAAFDVDKAGNMVLGAVADGVPPPAFSAAEDGVVLAHYSSSDGALQRIQTLNDLEISYKPSFSTLRNHMGPIYRIFASSYVAWPRSLRLDKSGNMYVLWGKKTADAALFNSLTISDTTLHHREEAYMRVLTKFDAHGALLWARKLDNHYVLYPGGLEVAENGHVYVWGNFRGRYVEFEGVRLTQEEPEGFDGFVAHYDESGHLVRALHLETTGDGDHFIEALELGASGDVYVSGRFGRDRAILGADTLYARGKGNLFIAKYGATSLSSEPPDGVPSGEIEVSNYPNPFRQRATIEYRVPAPGHVRLTVYDVLGRELAVLVDERQSAGSHSAKLDAPSWPSGVYLYRLEAGNQVATGRLVRHK
ncbi:MAG: T9SS type A sorting domain-containing protein [Rhodothermaceae bacterium]|nr:T9SS type A sorting domain-containing protein [Rhodothermaceae bacterium]